MFWLVLTLLISTPAWAAAPSVSLSYDGKLRDRVGQGENRLSSDGQSDGTFTVTLGGGNRTITRLYLNTPGGQWDTTPNNVIWTLGAAGTLDGPLLNAANETVSFPLTDGATFKIFAADCCGSGVFVDGQSFTLQATFSDGTSASASVTIGQTIPSVQPPTQQPNYMGGTGNFVLQFDNNFTILFAPGRTYTTQQSIDPDGSIRLEFYLQ